MKILRCRFNDIFNVQNSSPVVGDSLDIKHSGKRQFALMCNSGSQGWLLRCGGEASHPSAPPAERQQRQGAKIK